jgi:hypothetical protein
LFFSRRADDGVKSRRELWEREIALLSRERSECKPDRAQPPRKVGSGIAKRDTTSREGGWFP